VLSFLVGNGRGRGRGATYLALEIDDLPDLIVREATL